MKEKEELGTVGIDLLCLTHLFAFGDEKTRFVEKGRAVDVIYAGLSKAFNAISCSILVSRETLQSRPVNNQMDEKLR